MNPFFVAYQPSFLPWLFAQPAPLGIYHQPINLPLEHSDVPQPMPATEDRQVIQHSQAVRASETGVSQKPIEVSLKGGKKIANRKADHPGSTRRSELKMKRNTITNIGNQLFTFLSLPARSGKTLSRFLPDITSEQLNDYYLFARRMKHSSRGYFTFERLALIWAPERAREVDRLNYQILLKLSNYFINEKLPLGLMTSKMLHRESRLYHFGIRRKIMSLLSNRD